MIERVNDLMERQRNVDDANFGAEVGIVMDTLISMLEYEQKPTQLSHNYFHRVMDFDEICGRFMISVQLPGQLRITHDHIPITSSLTYTEERLGRTFNVFKYVRKGNTFLEERKRVRLEMGVHG